MMNEQNRINTIIKKFNNFSIIDGLLILAVGCLMLFSNINFGYFDPWESHYSQVSREMLEKGSLWEPAYRNRPFFDKPPMVFWMQRIGWSLFGFNEFGGRFFITFLALSSIIFLWFSIKKIFNSQVSLISALIFLSSPIVITLSRQIMFDSPFVSFLIFSLLSFLLAENETDSKKSFIYYILFYIFAAFAALSKALLGVFIPVGIIGLYILFTWDFRKLLRIHLLKGILLFLIITMPWFLLMYNKHGHEFLNIFIIETHLNRLSGHLTTTLREVIGPWSHYIRYVFVAMFPLSILIPFALGYIINWKSSFKETEEKNRLFIFLSFLVPLLIITISRTKFNHYIYPLIPWLSIMIALYLQAWIKQETKFNSGDNFQILLLIIFTIILTSDLIYEWRPFIDMFSYYYHLPVPEDINLKYYLLLTAIFVILFLILLIIPRMPKYISLIGLLFIALISNYYWGNITMIKLSQHYSFANIIKTYEDNSHSDEQIAEYGPWHRGIVFYTNNNFTHLGKNTNNLREFVNNKNKCFIIVSKDDFSAFRNIMKNLFPSSHLKIIDRSNYRLQLVEIEN